MKKNKFLTGCFVIIDINGKILFQKRDNKKNIWYPGLLGLFGGSIEKRESPLKCALREINEETNFKFRNLNLLMKIDFEPVKKNKFIYYKKIKFLPNKFNVNEGSGYKCLGYDDINNFKKEIISIDFYAVSMYLHFLKKKNVEKKIK